MEALIMIQQQHINKQYKQALSNYSQLANAKEVKENLDLLYVIRLNCSDCCYHLHDLEGSMQWLQQAQQMKNVDWRLDAQLAHTYFKQQNYSQCQTHIDKGVAQLQQVPNNQEILNQFTLLAQRCQVHKPTVIHPQPLNQKVKLEYSWNQTDKDVTITLKYLIKDSKQIQVEVGQDQQTVEIVVKLEEDQESQLVLKLAHPVKHSPTTKVDNQCIYIILNKVQECLNWTQLESMNNMPLSTHQKQEAGFYPSSAKVKRDWNKIDKQLDKELASMPDEDPMNKLFKQIYSNGNEDTKRAMIKSFQTSGGTVLSTNWNEVEKKDYENKDRPKAPEGQEWAK